MAISAYIGLPGHGKSYEVVRSVIIPAMLAGRRIVTNVYGIKEDKVKEYCLSHSNVAHDKLGQLVFVTNEQVMQHNFYCVPDVEDPVVHPGDLVILDECHRFFENDRTMPKEAKVFAAEHRHYVNAETGVTCDLVLVNQALTSMSKFLLSRIEMTYRMTKLVALGFRHRYRVDVFSGIKLTMVNRINSFQESYKKEIYSLYESHNIQNAVELETDKRGKLFSKSRIWYFIALILLLVWMVLRFIVPLFSGKSFGISKQAEGQAAEVATSSLSAASLPVVPAVSDKWCVSGFYFDGNRNFILLKDTSGHLRMVSRNTFQGDGIMLHGVVDGQQVNTWSCNNGGAS
ncbi:zonular occludens toxin [Salmonella enterica]|nr:zonular occludens toxin [Salmonella enterica]